MVTKRTIDTFGGIGSVLASFMCLGIDFWDRQMHSSIWKVWMIVFVLLLLNGVAMLKVAGKLPGAAKKMDKVDPADKQSARFSIPEAQLRRKIGPRAQVDVTRWVASPRGTRHEPLPIARVRGAT